MLKTLRQIIHLRTTLSVNAFLYYFKRLWLVGKCLPDSVYSDYSLKKVLAVIAVVFRQGIDFLGKPLYLLCFGGLPLLLALAARPELKAQSFSYFVQILFFLNCIIGAFGDSQLFTVTRDKVALVKYMRMNARSYVRSCFLYRYIPFFAYYLPWLLLAAGLLGASPVQGFLLWLVLFSFRMIGEAVQLLVFDRTGKVIYRNMFYEWGLMAAAFVGAYLPLMLGLEWPLAAVLLHPVSVLVLTALGGFCLWYVLAGYRGYEKKLHRTVDQNFLLTTMLKSSSQSAVAFKEVEIKETDAAISSAQAERFENLTGYAYLNALFFARHRRQLIKPVIYRLAIVAVLFAGAVVLTLINRELAVMLSGKMSAMLPAFVFIMYFMTVADKASRAMFYNCDKDLLHYAYYRQPQTILKNFQIRLLRVSLYDLAVAGGVCLAAVGFRLLCGGSAFSTDTLLFCLAILLLSVLFTAHHLCLYYIFQPYSESLQVKNPFFTVINGIMYALCFLCLQIETGSFSFTMGVLFFTIAYILAALILVYRFAPRGFRVK